MIKTYLRQRRFIFLICTALAIFGIQSTVYAGTSLSNTTIKGIQTYHDSERVLGYILIETNEPAGCQNIDHVEIALDGKNILSLALLAYTSGEKVLIHVDDCTQNPAIVHTLRIGGI